MAAFGTPACLHTLFAGNRCTEAGRLTFSRAAALLQATTEQLEALRNELASSEAQNAELRTRLSDVAGSAEQLPAAQLEIETLQQSVHEKDDLLAKAADAADRMRVARRAAEAVAEDMTQKAQGVQAELADLTSTIAETREAALRQCARQACCLASFVCTMAWKRPKCMPVLRTCIECRRTLRHMRSSHVLANQMSIVAQ